MIHVRPSVRFVPKWRHQWLFLSSKNVAYKKDIRMYLTKCIHFYHFNFSLKIRPGKIPDVKKFGYQNVRTVKYSERLFVRIFLRPNLLVSNVLVHFS